MTTPTVDDILYSTSIGNGFHEWGVIGGSIRITTDELRLALEVAYDPNMLDWVCLVDMDEVEAETKKDLCS